MVIIILLRISFPKVNLEQSPITVKDKEKNIYTFEEKNVKK